MRVAPAPRMGREGGFVMVRKLLLVGSLGIAALAALPAAAQQTAAPPEDLAKVNQQVRDTQEDLLLLRVLAGIKLSNAQMNGIVPTLEVVQQQLKDQDAKDAAQLKASQTALEAAVKQAANSSNPAPTRAEDDYQRTLAGIATRRTQLRATLVATVRRALMKTMSQDQLAAMVQ